MTDIVQIPGTSQVALRPLGCTDWQVVDVGPLADEITRLRARVEEIDNRCAGEVTALAMDVQEIARRALKGETDG